MSVRKRSRAQHPYNRSATLQQIMADPTAPFPHLVTVQEATRTLETSAEALLVQAKDEAIADLRDRVAFLEDQGAADLDEEGCTRRPWTPKTRIPGLFWPTSRSY